MHFYQYTIDFDGVDSSGDIPNLLAEFWMAAGFETHKLTLTQSVFRRNWNGLSKIFACGIGTLQDNCPLEISCNTLRRPKTTQLILSFNLSWGVHWSSEYAQLEKWCEHACENLIEFINEWLDYDDDD